MIHLCALISTSMDSHYIRLVKHRFHTAALVVTVDI